MKNLCEQQKFYLIAGLLGKKYNFQIEEIDLEFEEFEELTKYFEDKENQSFLQNVNEFLDSKDILQKKFYKYTDIESFGLTGVEKELLLGNIEHSSYITNNNLDKICNSFYRCDLYYIIEDLKEYGNGFNFCGLGFNFCGLVKEAALRILESIVSRMKEEELEFITLNY